MKPKKKRKSPECARCGGSGAVLNKARVMAREEAGPGFPPAFDPCPKCGGKLSAEETEHSAAPEGSAEEVKT